jgi:acyl-lipid omega-6 desaturase (Delta-12 desaturase)
LLSTDDFAQLNDAQQRQYALLRHPLMLLPGGFFYLVVKPRLSLVLGAIGFVKHLFNSLKDNPYQGLPRIVMSYKSKHWYTAGEFWDLLFNNIGVITSWVLLSRFLGVGVFFGLYFTTLTFSAAIFIYVFFVQHNFEGTYAHKTAGWDYLLGAIEGSSYLEFPTIIKWFSANIGYHNIHHLSERIPNYNLEACHNANAHLLGNIKTLKMGDMYGCSRFLLWDAAADRLISIEEFRGRAAEAQKLGALPG